MTGHNQSGWIIAVDDPGFFLIKLSPVLSITCGDVTVRSFKSSENFAMAAFWQELPCWGCYRWKRTVCNLPLLSHWQIYIIFFGWVPCIKFETENNPIGSQHLRNRQELFTINQPFDLTGQKGMASDFCFVNLESKVPNVQKPKGNLRKSANIWLSAAMNIWRSVLTHMFDVRVALRKRLRTKPKAPRFSSPYAKYPKPSHCHEDAARLQWTPSTSMLRGLLVYLAH